MKMPLREYKKRKGILLKSPYKTTLPQGAMATNFMQGTQERDAEIGGRPEEGECGGEVGGEVGGDVGGEVGGEAPGSARGSGGGGGGTTAGGAAAAEGLLSATESAGGVEAVTDIGAEGSVRGAVAGGSASVTVGEEEEATVAVAVVVTAAAVVREAEAEAEAGVIVERRFIGD